MSKINNYQNSTNKEEIKLNEPDSLYKLDIQLLSSLKSIPGKIIPLNNNMNQIPNNNKENNQDMNRKDTYNNFNRNDSINNINYPYNNDKMNINNNIINNNHTSNNFFLNNGFNNNNINFNSYNNYQRNNSGLIQNGFSNLDNQIIYSQSNHPSLLSFKSDLKNNNYLWSDIKFTQNSFTHNILLYNNENLNLKGNINKNNLINNNLKLSQLSYQFPNFNNDEILKKKKSTSILLRQNSDNNHNVEYNNKSINYIKINLERENNAKLKKEEININEEEKIIEDNDIPPSNNKKILFNIENFYEEEEDDTIYHNINNNKNDANNLFNCYLKKKKKRKKINPLNKYKCLHPKCDISYKTKKQLQNHHYKMSQECQLDSVQIIKLINSTKGILKKVIKNCNKKKEKFEKIYENSVKEVSLKTYFEFLAGLHFNDEK